MNFFAYTTNRYALWAIVVFVLHISNTFTILPFFIISILLVGSNYFFEKTKREKEYAHPFLDWLWLPITVITIVLVLIKYVL
ncbi:hypothetical protein [Planococcus halocryophilus]|uniref:hypothetical protein n=1 Tax=Planococcus halocryophilus TaxID=1215089 RepID=UPI001F0FDF6A|nr:hypothetical protein [Planococcus halocryophilus]MCH4825366.1 hypothetical protein [Planococcus halocryophilus]